MFPVRLIHGFADSAVATGRHPLRGLVSPRSAPRVRGLTRGFMPSPASRVSVACPLDPRVADSLVATGRHPLRGLVSPRSAPRVRGLTRGFMPSPASRVSVTSLTTGSRTHPWLYAATRFAGSRDGLPSVPRVRGGGTTFRLRLDPPTGHSTDPASVEARPFRLRLDAPTGVHRPCVGGGTTSS